MEWDRNPIAGDNYYVHMDEVEKMLGRETSKAMGMWKEVKSYVHV